MSDPVEVVIAARAGYEQWRTAARRLLVAGVAPEQVHFRHESAEHDLFARPFTHAAHEEPATAAATRVPRKFPALAERVVCHRDTGRYALLYRLLWRLQDERRLLDDLSDRDVWQAHRLAQSVRRDAHKMKAFVRFRRVEDDLGEAFVAWFEPQHHIVEYTAPFFQRRFTGMRWSIVTPERSAYWDGERLRFTAGASQRDCPDADALETHWRTYYASIYNPARLKVNAMRAEMPQKYWRNLPESRLIPELVRSAERAQRSAPAGTAPSSASARRLVALQPDMIAPSETPRDLTDLSRAVRLCERCELCRYATQGVPGTGPAQARLMLVGEQPGDQEDLAGKPFVGPAGQELNRALEAAGIERERIYLTNAVKHFKFRLQGKRRLHARPGANEIEHCRWWLGLERELVRPDLTVALGATAARALLGRSVRIADVRGEALHDATGQAVFVTVHPSYLLRLRDPARAAEERARFVEELRQANRIAGTG